MSAVKLKLSGCISGDCDILTVTEITGLYDANSNTTGWEDSTDGDTDKSLITSAVLEVLGPDQTTYTSITVTNAVVASSAFVEEFTLAVLAPSDIGMSTFENGLYTFIYTVVDASGAEMIKKISRVFLCPARKCYYNAQNDFLANFCPSCECCEDKEKLGDLMLMSAIIEAAESTNCLTSDQLNNLIVLTDRFCSDDPCCS